MIKVYIEIKDYIKLFLENRNNFNHNNYPNDTDDIILEKTVAILKLFYDFQYKVMTNFKRFIQE